MNKKQTKKYQIGSFLVLSLFFSVISLSIVSALNMTVSVAGGQRRNTASEQMNGNYLSITNTLQSAHQSTSINFTERVFEDGLIWDTQKCETEIYINGIGSQQIVGFSNMKSAKYYFQLVGYGTNGNGMVHVAGRMS